jgi:hypothetical protein
MKWKQKKPAYYFWIIVIFILFGFGSIGIFMQHFSFLWKQGNSLWNEKEVYQESVSQTWENQTSFFKQQAEKLVKPSIQETLVPLEEKRKKQEAVIEVVTDIFQTYLETNKTSEPTL